MIIVQQEDNYDCSLACIAMLTGMNLSTVKEKWNDKGEPPTDEECIAILASFNYGVYPTMNVIFENKVGMISVPSLNFPGLNHSIVFKSGPAGEPINFFDPNNGRPGKKHYVDNSAKCWSNVWNVVHFRDYL